jgi:tetratricopeptide (TPR) repeat protein
MVMKPTSAQNNSRFGAGILNSLLRPAPVCLVLAVITLAVFWPVTNCDFINFDDNNYVFANSKVQGGLTLDSVVWAFTTQETGNYWHPLTWLSLMLDTDLFRGMFENSATGPHLINLLLHVANTVLLFLVLRELTSAHWRSAFVAALFALHPLHVESVAWISERKDVLSTFFWLLALLAYGHYAGALKARMPRARFFYRGALLCFALGLMSKPMLVTLPFVLLLLDYWPLKRFPDFRFDAAIFLRLVQEKVPFFVLSAISCVITITVQRHYGAIRSLMVLPMGARVENAFVSYVRYLGKAFWPADLAVLYPYPGHWPLALVAFAVALVAGLTVAALWLGRFQPFLVTGWFWFLGTLVPVLGLIQVGRQSMADRYNYVPLIGVFIILSWGATALAARWRVPTVATVAAAILVLGACATRTADQIRYWQNSGTLFRRAIALTQNNYLAHDNLGIYLFTTGNEEAAIAEFRRALQINPKDPDTLNCLGAAMATRHQYAEANQYLQRLVQIHPGDPAAHFNYGAVLAEQEKWKEAAAEFSEALRLKPDFVTAKQQLENLNGRIQK